MNLLLLYFLMLKATLTTFSGQSSMPVIRQDFVVTYRLISDHQFNAAIAAGQSSPGPMGIFVVSVGYFARGAPGAMVAWLAVITPAFAVIPLLRFAGRATERPRIRSALNAAVVSSAGLILLSTAPLASVAIRDGWTLALAISAFAVLALTRVSTIWVVLASAFIGLVAALV